MWTERQVQEHEHWFQTLFIILAFYFILYILFRAVFHVTLFQRTTETIKTTMPLFVPATSSTAPNTGILTSAAASEPSSGAGGPSSATGVQNKTIEGIEPLRRTEELKVIIETLRKQRVHIDELFWDLRSTLIDQRQEIHRALVALESRQAEYHLAQRRIQEDGVGEIRSDNISTEEEEQERMKKKYHNFVVDTPRSGKK
ncbi:hypothetical protein BDB00DRAFT_928730 [Zychaea mexicana]|uniref:uncharacterized protein n=1 Tax=Zychaea mexicana TaxID=64656 RepID=UPI0022FE42F5|nr:uncharacterized protein BDB00DRAFT_928730 [Zychaea mexicana]KAI9493794.1 hypothetical protein BDB00DRAFT_928730 [Zychaea mexicana]